MELPKAYNPAEHEQDVYARWEASGVFAPHGKGPSFSMMMPPPNVTGTLHLGHAFEHTLQDILARYHRMRGDRTLWLPGTDHAAIATQAKFEKELQKTEGKSRHDFSREEFVGRVHAFAETNQQIILNQLKRLGDSVDWSRLAFTFDAARSRAVRTAFKRMYDAGLIYRGYRIVNWDPKGQTTISDDEVVHEETPGKLYTFRYSQDFPIAIATTRPETKVGDVAVAVHPDDPRYREFIGQTFNVRFVGVPLHIRVIGDAAVDPKYGTGAVGVTPAHSLVDWEMAERHELPFRQVINEYARMQNVTDELNGKKTIEARTMVVEELRTAGLLLKEEEIINNLSKAERTGGVIEPLPKLQWFVDVDKEFLLANSKLATIPSGSLTTLKQIMREAVASGQITIVPVHFRRVYDHWVDNLRDWCISRQILFGHRVPVWYRERPTTVRAQSRVWNLKIYGEQTFGAIAAGTKVFETRAGKPVGADKDWREFQPGETIRFTLVDPGTEAPVAGKIVTKQILSVTHFATIDEMFAHIPIAKVSPYYSPNEYKRWMEEHGFGHRIRDYGVWAFELGDPEQTNQEIYVGVEPPEGAGWEQDPDTLDTWFSSGLWTFSTLGWPDETDDLTVYHPTSLINPGYEILALWVSRMVMFAGFLLGDVPFQTVLFHGIVRDKDGRKFSKSLNNGIDPLEVISQYGTDALRMALTVGIAPGSDVKFDLEKVKAYQHFANKLWNISRFVLMNLDGYGADASLTSVDQRTLEEFTELAHSVTADLDNYRLYLAAENLYHYVWHTLADKILEAAKGRLQGPVGEDRRSAQRLLVELLRGSLLLLHPFMPFVTEALWSNLPGQKDRLLMAEPWPVEAGNNVA